MVCDQKTLKESVLAFFLNLHPLDTENKKGVLKIIIIAVEWSSVTCAYNFTDVLLKFIIPGSRLENRSISASILQKLLQHCSNRRKIAKRLFVQWH